MAQELPMSLIIGGVLLVAIIVFFVLPNASAIQSEQDKLKKIGWLGCCVEFQSQLDTSVCADESKLLSFQCSVPKDVEPSEKMGLGELYKKVNNVEVADIQKIRDACQCLKTAG